MSDAYLSFANSRLGSVITSILGLPQPQPLRRFSRHQPVLDGEVLVGAGPQPGLLEALVASFSAMQGRRSRMTAFRSGPLSPMQRG